jgi:hypothetical protein
MPTSRRYEIGRPGATPGAASRARARADHILAQGSERGEGSERSFQARGRRNPLKSLDPNKEIQRFFFDCLSTTGQTVNPDLQSPASRTA